MRRYLPTFGRLLIALIFLVTGFGKVVDPAGTQEMMAQHGLPLRTLLIVGAILLELGGGLSLLLGWKTRWGAAALIAFLIPTTLIFHTDFADEQQMIAFLHNLALMGGLLLVVTYGAGPLSLDARRRATGRNKRDPASRESVAA